MKLIYPAIFYQEDDSYWCEFPNLVGCQSFGSTVEEVFDGAKEALSAYCVTLLEQGKPLPAPSPIQSVKAETGGFTSLVEANLILKSRAVKKTLTIPSWLNDMAEERRVNFSGVLQNALMQELNINSRP